MAKLNLRDRILRDRDNKEKKQEYLIFKGLYTFFGFSQEDIYLLISRDIDWSDYYIDFESWKSAYNNRPVSILNKEDVRSVIVDLMSMMKDDVFSCMHDHSQLDVVREKYMEWVEAERIGLGWE